MDHTLGTVQALVVDDNKQMRFLLRSLLGAGGLHRVAEAQDADEAMKVMRRVAVDLILVDWCMAPIDGIAFTKQVRMAPDSPNPYAAIIMVSAYSEKFRVQEARDAGVNAFLVKPVSTRLLFERVQFALNDRRPFARSDTYFGPDRRFAAPDSNFLGPWRRAGDAGNVEFFSIDDCAA